MELPGASGLLETSPPVRTFRALGSTVPSIDSGKDKKQGVVSSIGPRRGGAILKASTVFSWSLLGNPWVEKRIRRQQETQDPHLHLGMSRTVLFSAVVTASLGGRQHV